jgi:hypothetical protein
LASQAKADAKTLIDGMQDPAGTLATMFNKIFYGLDQQLKASFGFNLNAKATAELVSRAAGTFVSGRLNEVGSLSARFTQGLDVAAEISKKDKALYAGMVDLLQSEQTRAEYSGKHRGVLDRTVTIKGKKVSGWEAAKMLREGLRETLADLAAKGIFIFNNHDASYNVLAKEEATYWPRRINIDEVAHRSKDLMTALAHSDKVRAHYRWKMEGEAGHTEKNDAVNNAKTVVDAIISRGWNDPLYNVFGRADGTPPKGLLGDLMMASDFALDPDEAFQVLGKGFQAKRERTLPAEVVEILRPYYETNVENVIHSYVQEASARASLHNAFGGYINQDGNRYVKDIGARRKILTDYEAASRTVDATRPDWYHRASALERLAQDGNLTYSPTAMATWSVRKMQALHADRKNTEWLRDTYYPALFNQLGQDIHPMWRTTNDVIGTGMRTLLLPLAPVSSLVEVANVGTRYADPALGRGLGESLGRAVRQMTKNFYQGLTTEKERQARFNDWLEIMGVTQHGLTRAVQAGMDSDKIIRPGIRKWNETFFKIIGLNKWTNAVGHAAWDLAHHDIATRIKNGDPTLDLELKKLGFTQAQWEAYVAAKQTTNQDSPLSEILDFKRENNDVILGLHKWTNSARLIPNPATRTGWGNDPRFALLWTLNDFPYAQGNVMMARVFQQMARNPNVGAKILYPSMVAIQFLLMGMAANVLRDMIKEIPSAGVKTALGVPEPGYDFFPESTAAKMGKSMLRSAVGAGSVLGSFEKPLNMAIHGVVDYRGNLFMSNISAPVKMALDINQIGLLSSLVNSTALLDSASKRAVRVKLNDLSNETSAFFRGG